MRSLCFEKGKEEKGKMVSMEEKEKGEGYSMKNLKKKQRRQ